MKDNQQILNFSDGEVYDKLKELTEIPDDKAASNSITGADNSSGAHKYYVHKTNAFNFKCESEAACTGSEFLKARNIREIEKGDKMLFLMPINSRAEDSGLPCKKLMFVASAIAGDRFITEKSVLGYDLCEIKLKIEGLEFFETPVSGEIFLKSLSSAHCASRLVTISDIIKTEYKQIEKKEFSSVFESSRRQACIPDYLKEILNLSQPEQGFKISKKYKIKEMIKIVNSAIGIYSMIRNEDEKARITELIEFISGVFEAAGVNKSVEELKEIYSKIGCYIDFEHIHTRDAGQGVKVLDKFGNISRFGYVKFEHPEI